MPLKFTDKEIEKIKGYFAGIAFRKKWKIHSTVRINRAKMLRF